MKAKKVITTEELDEKFGAGEDITRHLEVSTTRRPGLESQRLSVDAPAWMVQRLDHDARRLGITRQSLINVSLAERLEQDAA